MVPSTPLREGPKSRLESNITALEKNYNKPARSSGIFELLNHMYHGKERA